MSDPHVDAVRDDLDTLVLHADEELFEKTYNYIRQYY